MKLSFAIALLAAVAIAGRGNKKNKNSGRYVLLGLERCPEREPDEWLRYYNATLRVLLGNGGTTADARITEAQLREFGFLRDG